MIKQHQRKQGLFSEQEIDLFRKQSAYTNKVQKEMNNFFDSASELYSREKVLNFKKYLIYWLKGLEGTPISRIELNEILNKYNEVFGLEVGE